MILAVNQGDFDIANATQLPGHIETGKPTSNYQNLLGHQSADHAWSENTMVHVPTAKGNRRWTLDCKRSLLLPGSIITFDASLKSKTLLNSTCLFFTTPVVVVDSLKDQIRNHQCKTCGPTARLPELLLEIQEIRAAMIRTGLPGNPRGSRSIRELTVFWQSSPPLSPMTTNQRPTHEQGQPDR